MNNYVVTAFASRTSCFVDGVLRGGMLRTPIQARDTREACSKVLSSGKGLFIISVYKRPSVEDIQARDAAYEAYLIGLQGRSI